MDSGNTGDYKPRERSCYRKSMWFGIIMTESVFLQCSFCGFYSKNNKQRGVRFMIEKINEMIDTKNVMWAQTGLNCRPADYESDALTD